MFIHLFLDLFFLFLYFFLLLVLNTFQLQYEHRPEYYIYSALHSFVVFYITGVYLISVLENTSFLLGGSKEINGLLKIFRVRLKKVTKVVEDVADIVEGDVTDELKTHKRTKKASGKN